MNRPHLLKTITASATLLFAFSLGLTSPAAAPQKVAPIAKVAFHRQHISPPNAGVKLLEDILSRMRNLPQIAMSYNKQTYQYQQKAQSPSPAQGATDQLLAIRPKESSLKAKISDEKRKTTIAWGDTNSKGGDNFYAPRRMQMQKERRYSKDSDRSMGDDFKTAQVESTMGGKRALQQARPEYTREYGTVKPSPNSSAVRGTLMSNPAGSQSNSLASNSRQMSNLDAATKDITDRLSPEARQRLTASSGKLFDVAKKLEEAQQYAQGLSRQSPGGAGGGMGGVHNGPILADERHLQSGYFHNEGKQAKVISTNPLITEYDKAANAAAAQVAADEEAEAKPAEKAADKPQVIARGLVPPPPAAPMSIPFAGSEAAPQSAVQKPPAEPSLFKHVREFLNRDGVGNAVSGSPRQDAGSLEKNKPIEIALLPPSVVTGIPLVRLGTSENETNKALAGKGSLNKTQVNDWSVWSLQKPGHDDVSLQIYTRNGQVEAMRIFDSSLISPDFGVKLGDELGTVKHKFGEPAFILSEPQSRGGQNYVYPISQVSFQLAYTSKTTAPKVVSLLIFNAK